MIPELEQFLGRSDEKVLWRFSLMNFVALVACWMIGSKLGELFGMDGIPKFLLIGVWMLFGLVMTNKHRGMMRMHRVAMQVIGIGRVVFRAGGVDTSAWYAPVQQEARRKVRIKQRSLDSGNVRMNVQEE